MFAGLERWLETEQAGDPNLPYWLLTLSYGRHQAEALRRWSGGSIIISSSVNGTRTFSTPGVSAYSTSKAGQVAFMK